MLKINDKDTLSSKITVYFFNIIILFLKLNFKAIRLRVTFKKSQLNLQISKLKKLLEK
jgi:hypothetical protein